MFSAYVTIVETWVQSMRQRGDLQNGLLWHIDFFSFDDVFFILLLLSPSKPLSFALPSFLTLTLAAAMSAATGGLLRLRERLLVDLCANFLG